ncbi:MAG: DM13 domain-containing protein [Acidimicrobiales bacterium]
MTVLATATIDGHEARGRARLIHAADGTATIEVIDFWVAPGAPDVRLFISPDPSGTVDDSAIDLGPVPEGPATITRPIPSHVDPASLGSIIVYCKIYSVLFGYGTLAPRATP